MADINLIRSELLIPSSRSGAAILRGLSFGAELRLSSLGGVFAKQEVPAGWSCIDLECGWRTAHEASEIEWLLEEGFAAQDDGGSKITILGRGRNFLLELDVSAQRYAASMLSDHKKRILENVIVDARRDDPDADDFGLAQLVAVAILEVTCGREWLQRHVVTDRPPARFFRNGQPEDEHQTMGGLRLIFLAEMILNMQDVPGVAKSIRMVREGDVESGYAELEVGKLLFANQHKFQFVVPNGLKGSDYDLELLIDNQTICAETKCKFEKFDVSERGLLDALMKARKQLPSDQPCMVFVKVPQAWNATLGENEFGPFLKRATDKFFQNTERVVSVKFHSSLLMEVDNKWAPQILLLELDHPCHRFDRSVKWNLFSEMNKMPPHWVSLMDECS